MFIKRCHCYNATVAPSDIRNKRHRTQGVLTFRPKPFRPNCPEQLGRSGQLASPIQATEKKIAPFRPKLYAIQANCRFTNRTSLNKQIVPTDETNNWYSKRNLPNYGQHFKTKKSALVSC